MRIVTLASGSGGNCTLVSLAGVHFLIDAGISYRRIRNGLSLSGLQPEDLSAVLITHEHSDHISGLATMVKHCTVPLLAPRIVAASLRRTIAGVSPCLQTVTPGCPETVAGVRLFPFSTPHDTEQSVGWRLSGGGETFALSTDMGCVTEEILEGLLGADVALIEANHDVELLRLGPYPYHLKRRILSDHGHLSNDDCAALAVRLAQSGTKYLILGHLSQQNNHPALAYQTVRDALGELPTKLYVALAAERLTLETTAETTCNI